MWRQTDSRVFGGLSQQMRMLEEDMRVLKRDFYREREAQQRREQMGFLAEAAHALCQQVEAYVYHGDYNSQLVPLKLKHLAAKHYAGDLTQEQAGRWLCAKDVLDSYGVNGHVDTDDLIQADRYLRTLRSGSDHFTWQQRNNISLEMLIQWAAVHVDTHALLSVRGLIKVLSYFSSNDKPLCPDKALSQLVENWEHHDVPTKDYL